VSESTPASAPMSRNAFPETQGVPRPTLSTLEPTQRLPSSVSSMPAKANANALPPPPPSSTMTTTAPPPGLSPAPVATPLEQMASGSPPGLRYRGATPQLQLGIPSAIAGSQPSGGAISGGTPYAEPAPPAPALSAPDLWDMPTPQNHIPFGDVLAHTATAGDAHGMGPAVDINSLFAAGGNEPWAAALSPELSAAADSSDTRTANRATTQQSRMSRWFSSEEDHSEHEYQN